MARPLAESTSTVQMRGGPAPAMKPIRLPEGDQRG